MKERAWYAISSVFNRACSHYGPFARNLRQKRFFFLGSEQKSS
jgi:hypothetical protein